MRGVGVFYPYLDEKKRKKGAFSPTKIALFRIIGVNNLMIIWANTFVVWAGVAYVWANTFVVWAGVAYVWANT